MGDVFFQLFGMPVKRIRKNNEGQQQLPPPPGIQKTPADQRKDVIYEQIICNYILQKEEPHRT